VSTGFVYLRPLNVAVARSTGPYAVSASAAWQEMFAWLNAKGLMRDVTTGYGLLLDDPRRAEPAKCRYEACVELTDDIRWQLPETFAVRRLPGGAYARRRHVGGVVGLSHTIASMRNDWIPTQGLVVDTRRPVIEIYIDNPTRVPVEKQRIDICVPVTASATSSQSAA